MYLLTWGDGIGWLGTASVMVDISEKPALPFEYDALHFEEGTNLFIKVFNGVQSTLTEEEKDACRKLAPELFKTANYPVQVWDEDGIYRGQAMRKDMDTSPLSWALTTAPDHPASKRVGDTWERIVAVIMDDGTLREMPDGICDLCVKFFTAEEWENFPRPATPYETWNFVEEKWMDQRKLPEVKEEAKVLVRRVVESVRDRWLNSVPNLERQTWQKQEEEARKWLADNTVETPFIDVALAARDISKTAFCEDVVHNANRAWELLAHAHNLQWKFFDKIATYTTLEEVDKFVFDFGDEKFPLPTGEDA